MSTTTKTGRRGPVAEPFAPCDGPPEQRSARPMEYIAYHLSETVPLLANIARRAKEPIFAKPKSIPS